MSALPRTGRLSATGLAGRYWAIKVVRGLAGGDVFLVREEGLGRVLVAKVVPTANARERDMVLAEAALWRKVGEAPASRASVTAPDSVPVSTGAALTAMAAMAGSQFATPQDQADSASLASFGTGFAQDRPWRHLVRLEDVLVVNRKADNDHSNHSQEPDAVVFLMEQCLEMTRDRVNTEDRILRAIAHVAAAVDECWEVTQNPFGAVAMRHCFIAEDGRVKVAGFGLTRALKLGSRDPPHRSEQQDIFDIGVLLFELIFAKPPTVYEDGTSSIRIPKSSTSPLATPKLLQILRYTFGASQDSATKNSRRKHDSPTLLDLRYHIAASRNLVPPPVSDPPPTPCQANGASNVASHAPPQPNARTQPATPTASSRVLGSASTGLHQHTQSAGGNSNSARNPQGPAVVASRTVASPKASAANSSGLKITMPQRDQTLSAPRATASPREVPANTASQTSGPLSKTVSSLARPAAPSGTQYPMQKSSSTPRVSPSGAHLATPAGKAVPVVRASGALTDMAVLPNKAVTPIRTTPAQHPNGTSNAIPVRGLAAAAAAAARNAVTHSNGHTPSAPTRAQPMMSPSAPPKEEATRSTHMSPTKRPTESSVTPEASPQPKSHLTRAQLASKSFRDKLVGIISSDSKPIRNQDLQLVLTELCERKLASSDVFESLYQQNISKDPVAAFKATVIIVAGLACGSDYFTETTYRQREYVAWLEECYTKDRMTHRSAKKRHQHHDSYINGEIAAMCTCARRKSSFSVESEPGFTGTWAPKAAKNGLDWRAARKTLIAVYDLLEAIDKVIRLIAAAEDQDASLKQSVAPVLLADAVESHAAVQDLVKSLPVDDRSKCYADFSACHQTVKAIVDIVRSKRELRAQCKERYLEPVPAESPFSPPSTRRDSGDSEVSLDPEMMKKLTHMGFSSSDASRSLKKTNNNFASAVALLSDRKSDQLNAKKKKGDGPVAHESKAVPIVMPAQVIGKEPTKAMSVATSKATVKRRKAKSDRSIGEITKTDENARSGNVKATDVPIQELPVETKPAAINNFYREDLTKMDPIFEVDPGEITLQEEIGRGGFGTVYLAKIQGRKVAVKKIHPQSVKSRNAVEEFQREIAVLCRLSHPNILLFMGACIKPPNLMIITEFMANGTLFDLLHRSNKRLTWKMIVGFALNVCHGLNYLHKSHLLHRDIKSSNMMLDDELVVKVGDFGLTRVVSKNAVPMTGQTGTFQYMAPEVLSSKPYSEKADVFSFGILLWETVARKLPYFGMQPMQVGMAVVNQKLRPTIPSDCPSPLARLMKQCWDHDPLRRPSLDIVIRALESIDS